MPSKNTTVITARVPNHVIEAMREKCDKKGWTPNRFINWALTLGIRSHKKKE